MSLSVNSLRLCVVAAVVATAAGALAQGSVSSSIAPTRLPYSQLFAMPAVQDELKVTDDQKAKLKSLETRLSSANKELGPIMARSIPKVDGQVEQAVKKVNDLTEELGNALKETLTSEQMGRLKELALQTTGTPALNVAEIQRDLGLSEGQIDKIKGCTTTLKSAIVNPAKKADAQQVLKAMETNEKQLLEVLTEEQREAFIKMRGEPFAINKSKRPPRSGASK